MKCGTAIFDFDSTVIAVESFDEIIRCAIEEARHAEAEAETLTQALSGITDAGMNGSITFSESITRRLALASVHRRHIDAFNRRLSSGDLFTEGMREIIDALQSEGHTVCIVSGALRECLACVSDLLDIAPESVVGNDAVFDAEGWITGLDLNNPLSSSEGKTAVIRALRESGRAPGPAIMIGDGTNDLRPWQDGAVDHFVGCGIHKIRPTVQMSAPAFVTDAQNLHAEILSFLSRA